MKVSVSLLRYILLNEFSKDSRCELKMTISQKKSDQFSIQVDDLKNSQKTTHFSRQFVEF
jgi:hypothetical protein